MATTDTTDATAIQQRMLDAVARGDVRALRELAHPDYTYTAPDGETHAGVEAGLAVAEEIHVAFPDLEIEVMRTHRPDPSTSIAELRLRATHGGPYGGLAATGRRVEGVGCNIVEVRDGRIIAERDYWDDLSILRQLGAFPG